MALRAIELILPASKREEVETALAEMRVLDVWAQPTADGEQVVVKILVDVEATEAILDLLDGRFSGSAGFRVVLYAVEASLPRPEPAPDEGPRGEGVPPEGGPATRISREELIEDVQGSTKLTAVYVVMVTLSSVVAALGLLKNNVAVIIGAMVIAPLLGPNIALSLATTLADFELGVRALKTNLAGLALGLALAVLLGWLLEVDPATPQIASRTAVDLGDIALALASGSAGALAITTGVSAALVGVMVAVALLPPLVATGLLLGAGHELLALSAFLLVVTNVICVNLAGVLTFVAQGIRPVTWWAADRAKRATAAAIALWAVLLLALAVAIHFSPKG